MGSEGNASHYLGRPRNVSAGLVRRQPDVPPKEHGPRPGGQGVPALIHVARTSPQAELRKSALFWLGQSDDPRALALFEEILR